MRAYRTLEAWKNARALNGTTLRSLAGGPRTFALFDQIRRASVSIEANIVEGYALQTTPQFKRHLRIALASAVELETLVELAIEAGFIPPSTAGEMTTLVDRQIGLLFGLIRKLEFYGKRPR